MRKGWIGVLVFVLMALVGCGDKNKVPSDILPANKMYGIIWDLIQADQYSVLYLAKDSARKDSAHIDLKTENLRLYEQVFQLHKTSRDEFRRSFQFYLDHPELNQSIYDSLISLGNRERADMYNKRPNNTFKSSSPSPALTTPGALSHPGSPGAPGASRFPPPNGKPGSNGRPGGNGGPIPDGNAGPQGRPANLFDHGRPPGAGMPDSTRRRLLHQGIKPFQHVPPPPSGKQPAV